MKKIVFTVVAIALLNIAPLLGEPALMLHFKTLTLVVIAACLWLSQPTFSSRDTRQNRKSDRSSILVILIMSSASVLFSVLEWAYFSAGQNKVNYMTLAGGILMLAGVVVRITAIRTLGRHFTATATINSDHQLIQSGLYRLVRHPSYLGAFMAIVGTPIFLNNGWAVPFAIAAMCVAYYIRITVEEKMLEGYFGEKYTQYKMTTKRIIPFIW